MPIVTRIQARLQPDNRVSKNYITTIAPLLYSLVKLHHSIKGIDISCVVV